MTPASFCFEQRVAADELAFVQLDDPAEVGFEGVMEASISWP